MFQAAETQHEGRIEGRGTIMGRKTHPCLFNQQLKEVSDIEKSCQWLEKVSLKNSMESLIKNEE